ncbi:MAG TPA: hypothetical protein VF832_10335, partial [Longimicrobiales bacterium]
MNGDQLHALLTELAEGRETVSGAVERLAWLPVEVVSAESGEIARVDHHRELRQGYPEVVFAEGKTERQVVEICRRLAERGSGFLVTRADESRRAAVLEAFPAAVAHDVARTVR